MNASSGLKPALRTIDTQAGALHAGWSVAPLSYLHRGTVASRHRRWSAAERAFEGAGRATPQLRFVADFVRPVANENFIALVNEERNTEEVSGEANVEVEPVAIYRDGDWVAIGTLTCLLSAIGTVAVLTWLANAVL